MKGTEASFFVVVFKDFIYSSETQREAEIQAEREAGFMQEPNVGLDFGTSGSCPEPKAEMLNH